jgi:hypothetical protein
MAKKPQTPRITIKKEGLIMEVPEDRRSKFIKAAIVEVFADQELFDRIMKRVTGLTVNAFLRPGQIIVDSATMQPVEQKPPKADPQEPVKVITPRDAPVAKSAPDKLVPEQKTAAQPREGVEAGVRPAPVEGRPFVMVKHHFDDDEPEA